MSWIDEVTQGRVPYRYGEKLMSWSKKKSYYLCPEPGCGKKMVRGCLCPINDVECAAGHHWHLKQEGNKQIIAKGEGIH